jgi:Cu(I)/Ag(I) efflux system membrane fusion protein
MVEENKLRFGRARILGAAVVLLVVTLSFWGPLSRWFSSPKTPAASQASADHYTCSMHPSIQSPVPGACPLCGMTLVQVSAQQRADGVVHVDAASRELAGIHTARVEALPMRLAFAGSGRITYDETAVSDVTMRVRGIAEKLFVKSVGQHVVQEQPLFTLYSTELYEAQRTFLSRADSPSERERLRLLGMSETQVAALATSRKPTLATDIVAPRTGYAVLKDVVEGSVVPLGTRVFRIAATDTVWIETDVLDRDIVSLREGQQAEVTLDYVPGKAYDAVVLYVFPYLETSNRTGRARLQLVNEADAPQFRPGMAVSVRFDVDVGTVLQVPESAILYTGPRLLAFVSLDEQRFRPQEVRIGRSARGMVEVLSGLEAGQMVASSGVFLLAAEARINSAAAYWQAEGPPPPAAVAQQPSAAAEPPPPAAAAAGFSCPMHPEVQSPTPGKCPKCGMALESAPAP